MKLKTDQKLLFKESDISFRELKIFSPEDTNLFRRKWEDIYINQNNNDNSIQLHKCSGCDNFDGSSSYNWHIFSFEKSPFKIVTEDFLKDLNFSNIKLIMLWEECGFPAVEILYSLCKKFNFHSCNADDIYFFPENLDWTFVIPHDEDCGPYYSDKKLMNITDIA
jgi:hypothetical protein